MAALYGRKREYCGGPQKGEVWTGNGWTYGRGDDDNLALPLDFLNGVLNAVQGKLDEEESSMD